MSDVVIVDSDNFTPLGAGESANLSQVSKWSRQGRVREYRGSRLVASEAGISWSYSFVGSAVEIVGGLLPGQPSRKLVFLIDGKTVGEYNSPTSVGGFQQWHQTFFKSSGLDPVQNHTVQVTQVDVPDAVDQNPISFDYLLYTASDATPLTADTRFFIDERDSKVSYSTPPPDRPNTADFFRGGITKVADPNNAVTMTFKGTKVEVYGCANTNDAPRSLFAVDSQSPQLQFSPAQPDVELQYNQLLWESLPLDGAQQHTLKMNFANGTGGLCLDYLLVTPAQKAAVSISGTGSASAAIPSVSVVPSNGTSIGTSANVHLASPMKPGHIALTVLGGLLLAAALFTASRCIWKRRQKRHGTQIREPAEMTQVPRQVLLYAPAPAETNGPLALIQSVQRNIGGLLGRLGRYWNGPPEVNQTTRPSTTAASLSRTTDRIEGDAPPPSSVLSTVGGMLGRLRRNWNGPPEVDRSTKPTPAQLEGNARPMSEAATAGSARPYSTSVASVAFSNSPFAPSTLRDVNIHPQSLRGMSEVASGHSSSRALSSSWAAASGSPTSADHSLRDSVDNHPPAYSESSHSGEMVQVSRGLDEKFPSSFNSPNQAH